MDFTPLTFDLEEGSQLNYEPSRLINAGYTGRDQKAVQEHVEELRKMGIPAPARTPSFFPKSADRLQQTGIVYALDGQCSAEVEFVILVGQNEWFVTVGCDVFDYKVEGLQADKSKLLYPNYLAQKAWRYKDVKDHWDKLLLRSWLDADRKKLYQEGTLAEIMTPENMMKALEGQMMDGIVDGTVLSGGTLSCLVDGMPYTDAFAFELEDPVLKRSIAGVVPFQQMTWFRK